jgi:hypothetical protein
MAKISKICFSCSIIIIHCITLKRLQFNC